MKHRWVGITIIAMCAAAMLASARWRIAVIPWTDYDLGIAWGRVTFAWSSESEGAEAEPRSRFALERLPDGLRWGFSFAKGSGWGLIAVPLWAPGALALSIPWALRRRSLVSMSDRQRSRARRVRAWRAIAGAVSRLWWSTTWRAATAIVLGALTTVGIAWISAWFIGCKTIPASRVVRVGGMTVWHVDVVAFPGGTLETWSPSLDLRGEGGSDNAELWRKIVDRAKEVPGTGPLGGPVADTPRWPRTASGVPEWEKSVEVVRQTRGWPRPALYCYREVYVSYPNGRPGRFERSIIGALLTGEDGGAPSPNWRVLPYLPIASGLALDTAAFAGLGFILLSVPAAIRFWRGRAGRCVGCGYDLTGNTTNVCPECGKAFEAKGAAP